MKIKIQDHEIELQYCMRMYLKYEERAGKSISFEGMTSFTGISELLYCAIAATLEHVKYRDLGLTMTWEEFLDWTDTQNSNKLIEDFNAWLVEINQAQRDSSNEAITEEETEEKDPN